MLDLGKLKVGIEVDSDGAKQKLSEFSGDVDKTSTGISGKMKGLAGKMGHFLAVGAAAAAAAVGAAVVKITKDALEAYAQFEQLEGGVKKIFGKDAAKTVMENAQNAFKTAGISANEYMEQVTSFSASLIQSLGGDTEKAAQVADMAVQDMADNANTFGTDIASIQNAYQGFAKQNYTMLDNLKLGYGGTKEEMQRLLADAEKFSGVHYDITNLNDVYEAIHVIQEEMGVTGTTAEEAMNTIEGSVNATKAAWNNLLVGLGDEKANMDKLISDLITSAGAALKNILPKIGQILKSLIKSLISVAKSTSKSGLTEVVDSIGKEIETWPDALMKTIIQIIDTLADLAESDASSQFGKVAADVVTKIGKVLVANAPRLIMACMRLVLNIYRSQMNFIYTFTVTLFNRVKAAITKAWNAIKRKIAEKIKVAIDDSPLSSLISKISSTINWWDKLKKKLAEKAKGIIETITQGGKKHRVGLKEVPYDGYQAILHKGEAVLTAAETNLYNKALNKFLQGDNTSEQPQVTNNEKNISYSFGDITVDVSRLKDITTVEDFVDMMVRAKQFA